MLVLSNILRILRYRWIKRWK